jgi:hypothetical protein
MQYPRWLLRFKAPLVIPVLDGNTIHIAHDLKIWPQEFQAIRAGIKTFEIRKFHDRDFHVGDVLKLSEFKPEENLTDWVRVEWRGQYTNRFEVVRILYISSGTFTSRDSCLAHKVMSIARLGLTESRQLGIELHVQDGPQLP